MYTIKEFRGSFDLDLLAAFSSENGIIHFSQNGDLEFIRALQSKGVPDLDGERVFPGDGERFAQACLNFFCGSVVCNDENELRRINAHYPSPRRYSLPPPASVA